MGDDRKLADLTVTELLSVVRGQQSDPDDRPMNVAYLRQQVDRLRAEIAETNTKIDRALHGIATMDNAIHELEQWRRKVRTFLKTKYPEDVPHDDHTKDRGGVADGAAERDRGK